MQLSHILQKALLGLVSLKALKSGIVKFGSNFLIDVVGEGSVSLECLLCLCNKFQTSQLGFYLSRVAPYVDLNL